MLGTLSVAELHVWAYIIFWPLKTPLQRWLFLYSDSKNPRNQSLENERESLSFIQGGNDLEKKMLRLIDLRLELRNCI